MSHVVVMKTRILRLDALRKAVEKLGGTLQLGQKTYRWYGRWMDDYHENDAAYRQGIKVEDYGTCDHAISFPGCSYEVGVVQQGQEYALVWDYVDYGLRDKLGGEKAERLMQAYGVEAAILTAEEEGYVYEGQTVQEDGSIRLEFARY
jgi:hypothetical protein